MRKELIDLIRKELQDIRSARVQMTTWIRFSKDNELIDLTLTAPHGLGSQTMLTQSGAPGHVIGWTNFSH